MPRKKSSDHQKALRNKAHKLHMQKQRLSAVQNQEDIAVASDTSDAEDAGFPAKRQRMNPSALSQPLQPVPPLPVDVGSEDVIAPNTTQLPTPHAVTPQSLPVPVEDTSICSSLSSHLQHSPLEPRTNLKSGCKRSTSCAHTAVAAKKQLYTDFADENHREISEKFLHGKDIRQKKGRKTTCVLSATLRKRRRNARFYAERSHQIRAQKVARYQKSPAFKSSVFNTAAARYKTLTQARNRKYHRAAINRAQRIIQRIRYHKSPRTHHRWLESSRRREISPSRRARINQTRRGSRVRSATVLAAYRRNEVLRARKHRKRAICLKFKRKYEDMRLQRITRYGRDRMQVGEQNFARWATLRLLRSYIAGVGAQGNPRSRLQFQKRHFISRCISNTLILRRNRIRRLIDMLDRLRDHWAEIEVKSKCSASRDSVLEEKYGGPRYHVASSEPYGFDRTTKQYGNLADIKEALRIDDMESEDPVSGQPVPGHHQPFPVSPQTVPMSTEAHPAQVLPVACGQAPSAAEPLPVSGPGSVGHQAMDAQPSSVSGQPVPDHHQPFHVSPQPVPMSTEAHTAQFLPVACGQAPLAAEPLPVSGPGSVGYHAMDAPQPSSVSGQPVSDQGQPVAVASQSVPPSTEAHTAQVLPVAYGQAPSAAEPLPVSGPSSVGHQAMDAQPCSVSSQPPCSVSSQPTSDHGQHVDPQPLPSETGAEKDDQWKNKGRICDEDCFVPDNWAQKLHEAIKKLTGCGSYNDRLQNVMNFEICKGCRDSATNQLCLNLDLCQDNFRILRQMIAPHFSSARSLQRRLYRIRKAAMWILEYESVVCCGSWELFYQFIIQKTELFKKPNGTTHNTEDSDRRLTTDNMEQQAEDQFGALGRTWQEKLRDFPINPCAVCLRLFENNKLIKGLKSDSRRLKKENFHPQLSQYVDTGNVQFPCDLCDRCLKDMNDGMLPRYSVLNDMGVDDLPEELSSLNYLGRMLLQRQKSFLSIFRMRPYRYRGPICNLTKAVRGCVVHLPMPKDTMPTTFAQLPSTHNVSILIDSLPTKQKIIWRDLIDVEQWKQAAEKIKEINPFYRDVVINPAVLEEEAPAESDPDALPDLMPANPLTRHQQADGESADTLLRRVPATETYQQFTVQSVNQKIPNVSDIDLFAMKKVTAEPVSESDVTRDMLSYPIVEAGEAVKRNKCIVKYAKINPSASDANREKYFHNLLMLYKPWRDECELLGNFRSYEDSFLAIVNEPAFENMKAANRAREELENALKFAKEVEKKAEAERQQQIEDQDAEEAAMGGFNADAGITLGPAVPLEVDQLTLRENQLNEEQKQIYGKIVEAVQHRETEHRASNTACACADVCNLAFISGVGGTGKSHLIETIVAKVCHQFGNDSVAVAAPTGLASLNISGVTLHKLLKLPVQHGVDAEFWNLGKPDVKSMRNFFKNVRVFIIDEISMVSNVVLAYCHARFNELFGIDDTFLPFGGVMLIVFGDLLQFPPVRSQFVFEPLSRGVIRKIFGGVDAGANLWHEFRYFELLHNMRQRDDLEYAEMRGRARVGCSTPEDVEKFEGRLVYTDGAGKFVTKNMISNSDTTAYRLLTMEEAAVFLKQLVDKDSTGTLALLPKNEACDAINNTILKESFSELYPVIPAEDSMSGGKIQRKKRKKTKASDTGGLPDELILGKGCRVMIRRNINQSRRLMNGSLGTLVDVKFKPTREGKQSADKLVVAIDGVSQTAKLDRVMCKFNLSKNLIYTRRQFPVIVAYAVTDHKSQALSLNTVLIDLGPDCFASGMAYVALSRCRRLSNVFLLRFDPKVVRCEPSCVKEYNRLRQKFTNLQKIAKYNTILNEAKKVRRSRVAVDRLLTDDIRTRDSRQSVTDIARKKKKPANAEINRTLHVPFPHFENQQNSCYANSVVQSLMSINDEFFWPRLETFGDNPVCCELVKLRKAYLANNATPLSTDELRRSVGPPFNNFGAQDDAGMFLMTLIDKFPPDVKRHFLHDKVDMSKCLECNRWSCNPAQFQHDVCIWQSYPHLRCQFDDIIRNSQTQTLQCEHCRRRTEQTVSEFPMLTQTKHYFWIQLNFFQRNVNGQYERRPFSMQGMKSSGITLRHCVFDEIEGVKQATRKTFKPVSFVVHQGGNTPDSGHYTTWVKLDKNWCLISDDHVVKTSPMIPPGLHSCYLILMASS